ncbi:hypothetical protein LWI28_025169 [Acer negundo]|uniref:50S ribosomal protein L35 n=1 Tax=Acer negundo TaxID=4023 RepID=A0AAD5IW02_ACENE|nr:hypothetical protein LWI28_025169 [Acer negundo]KAK4846689.1 hypothetical protein QYF36_020863 [Acer negundo]
MQRVCLKIRALAAQSTQTLVSSRRLLHSSPTIHQTSHFPSSTRCLLFTNSSSSSSCRTTPSCYSSFAATPFYSSRFPLSLVQVRHVSSRERKKRRKPMTPVTSKVKKTKMKSYSSFKSRFRTMNDGKIRRWHEGKLHNAHLKSKKAKRRLRQPALVPAAYAKVMKKLNFCG